MRTIFAVLTAALIGGCHSPPQYVGEPLPRFLADAAPVAVPAAAETPSVPVADRPAITLPQAVAECVLNNMRLKVAAEKISLAQADYVSESLIPNAQLFVDAQLLPITPATFDNQAGPPQYDALVTLPVDWFLFGKRVAARAAAQLNVDVAQAEFADQQRRQLALTIDSFYDALEADLALKLAENDLAALQNLERIAAERAKGDEKSTLEQRRVRLAVLDIQREIRKRRAAAETTKSRLQANVGRPPDTPDFVVRGTLAVRATAPALTVQQAWALAEQHRPDLIAAKRGIAAADGAVDRERRKAYPQVAVTGGVDYQDQQRITGFRNASLFTLALTGTLPFTDRNQGHILGAQSNLRAAAANLSAVTADARSEVEQAVAEYGEAVNGVTEEDVTSLRTARQVRDETLALYRKGEKDIVDALDAERAYRDRLRNTLANLADYWQALNHVNAAVGQRVMTAQEADRDTLLEEAKPPPK